MQTTTESKPKQGATHAKGSKEDAKPNGKPNGAATDAGDGVIPFPERTEDSVEASTGVQHPDHYDPPQEPEQEDLKVADEVYQGLQSNAAEMGAQRVIDALIAIVDVHTLFRTPEIFSGSESPDEEDRYDPAAPVAEIARFLARSTSKLEVNPNLLAFYFKDHEKWTSHGQKVHGKVKRFDGFLKHHLEGQLGAVIVNYHLWKTLNPRQKVFTVYRLLRELDAKGGKRAPDFVGYFEEPGLFGAGVLEEHVKMCRAFAQEARLHVGEVYQLSLMAGIFDED